MPKEHRPKRLVIFSRDELKQHDTRASGLDHPSLRYFIGDVRDAAGLERAFAGVTVVIHAAALRQVPACEYNPFEAIQTNIMGRAECNRRRHQSGHSAGSRAEH